MLPPDALVGSDQVKPVPLPPAAAKVMLPLVVTLAVAGEIETPAVTATFLVAVFPSDSVTWTVSVTPPVAPALYSPVDAAMLPPEALLANDQAKPKPLPPD